jgi:hypothetical protein
MSIIKGILSIIVFFIGVFIVAGVAAFACMYIISAIVLAFNHMLLNPIIHAALPQSLGCGVGTGFGTALVNTAFTANTTWNNGPFWILRQ